MRGIQKPNGNEECINQEVSILKIEKLKALALGGELGGVILVIAAITAQTKEAMQKMRNLEVDLQKAGIRLKFMDYFHLLAPLLEYEYEKLYSRLEDFDSKD